MTNPIPVERVVYAKTTGSVGTSHGVERIREGEPWDADDPTVIENPDAFTRGPARVRRSAGESAPVEQATAAPGEKRSTRRSTGA